MSDSSKRTYSYIYSKLVENEDDILGHIAYSIYKSHKIAEIERLCSEKKVDFVSDADIEPFIQMAQSERQIKFYREHADVLANAFLDSTIKESIEMRRVELESEYKVRYEKLLEDCKAKPWYYDVGLGVVSSFVFLALGYLLLLGTGSWDKLIAPFIK